METVIDSIDKVLVIDDNEIDTLICSKVFKKYKNTVQVTACLGAKEALNYLTDTLGRNPENLPDLILLDLYMPLMNGWFFLGEYKKIIANINKKIVLLVASSTAYDKDLNQIQTHKEIDGYIGKPLTVEKIQHIQEKYFS